MKDKTNKWLPWISSLLIAILIAYTLTVISDSVSLSSSARIFMPDPVPSTQVLSISAYESINEFSGKNSGIYPYKGALAGITISLILILVIIPFLYVKGTLQSERRENPTILWYLGSALMFWIILVPIIGGVVNIYSFQIAKENSEKSKTQDKMRMELTDVSFVLAEQILELDDISEINIENIAKIKNSEFGYLLVSNPEDSSVVITISSNKLNNFTATTIVRPYSDQIFKYQTTY